MTVSGYSHSYVQPEDFALSKPSSLYDILSLHCSAKSVTIWPWAVQCDMGCDDGMIIPKVKSIAFRVSVIITCWIRFYIGAYGTAS